MPARPFFPWTSRAAASVPRPLDTRFAAIAPLVKSVEGLADLRSATAGPALGGDDRPITSDGRTALQVLRDQLDLLDSKLDEVAEDLQQRNVDRLLAHQRFLEQHFGDLSAAEPGPPAGGAPGPDRGGGPAPPGERGIDASHAPGRTDGGNPSPDLATSPAAEGRPAVGGGDGGR